MLIRIPAVTLRSFTSVEIADLARGSPHKITAIHAGSVMGKPIHGIENPPILWSMKKLTIRAARDIKRAAFSLKMAFHFEPQHEQHPPLWLFEEEQQAPLCASASLCFEQEHSELSCFEAQQQCSLPEFSLGLFSDSFAFEWQQQCPLLSASRFLLFSHEQDII